MNFLKRLPARGFILPEILMTLALLAILASLSALAGSDSYQRALAANDVERIAGALRRARSLAQAGTCRTSPCDGPKAQGVRVAPGQLHMFEGSDTYETFPLSDALVIEAAEIVFLPRSGKSHHEKTLRMTDAYGRNRSITVSEMGVVIIQSL